ncbi:NAD(P)/FAD-dependent oxidoreductase [Agromyces sp. PvR057]|uniref:FAD-dependent oxidoreductase n=1 Tax=Agromyces sp. PvR057 TaxID=3156403 RepID=UPI00339B86DF
MPERAAGAGGAGSSVEARHDVVIVGGGAVGLLLGCLLAGRGIDVVVLERRMSRGTGRSRAIGIHPPGLRALARAGVETEVVAAAVPIRDGRATCGGRTLGTMSFRGRGGGGSGSAVLSLPQLETEAILERRLGDLRPGGMRRGVEVRAVHDRGADVQVDAVVDGASLRLTARYVVGADGVRSGIRSSLELGWRPRRGRAQYVMCDTRDDTGEAETALLHFEPAGVVESFPMPGGRRRWVARVRRPPAHLTPETLAAIVGSRTGGGFDVAAASEPSAFEARQHLADRMAVGRIALAGDAAHEISPIGGQGMNLGWLDALRLDHDLAAALAVGAPFEAFDVYDRVRRSAARRAVRRAAFNMAVGAPASGARLRVRNAAVRTLDLPPLRSLLARAFTMRGL